MGSYGIGISRLVGAIIEAFHDDKGIIWPEQIAPFFASIINVNTKNDKCTEISEQIYEKFINRNIDILYDNRDIGVGSKFSDNDLIGIPYKIIVGPRDLKNNSVEIEYRKTGEKLKLSPDESYNFITDKLKTFKYL